MLMLPSHIAVYYSTPNAVQCLPYILAVSAAYCYVDRERPCVQIASHSSARADSAAATRPAADDNVAPAHRPTTCWQDREKEIGVSAAGRDLGPRGRMISAQRRQGGLLASSCRPQPWRHLLSAQRRQGADGCWPRP